MEELLKLVREHYTLTPESELVFMEVVKNSMNSMLNSDVTTSNIPVFLAMFFDKLQDKMDIVYTTESNIPTFRIGVEVYDEDVYSTFESHMVRLLGVVVSTFIEKKYEFVMINSVRLSTSRNRLNCDIRMTY
jgi:hypothetical protein